MAATIELRSEELTKHMTAAGIGNVALAHTTGMARSSVHRVRRGAQAPGERFIAGVLAAFPALTFDDLFVISNGEQMPA